MKMCLTLSLVLLATIATAAEPSRPAVSDVALQQDGVLRGQVLNTTGTPQAKLQVALVKNGKLVATTETNTKGEFAIANVNPGVYQIESQHAGGVYRVWEKRTAPPAAKSGVLMVGDTNVVRAQLGGEKYGPAIRGAIAGGLAGAGLAVALDHNPAGS
jgi:protease II